MRLLLIVGALLLGVSDSRHAGFRPFELVADSLVQRGIALLKCDDRGAGGSTGCVADAIIEAFADDARAVHAVLRGPWMSFFISVDPEAPSAKAAGGH
jgi:alpha-beta hydrolase superfamily lysophospholipase